MDPARIGALEAQLGNLSQRIAQFEQRPAPTATPSGAGPAQPPDLGPLNTRLSALEQRLQALANQPAAQRPAAPAPAPAPDISGAVAPLAARLDRLAGQQQTEQSTLETRLAALEKRVDEADQHATQSVGQATRAADQASRAADQAARANRIQQAASALDAGNPLGEIAGAPPALARFATTKPPTEAALRLAFPEAAARAEQASNPSTEGQSLGERMWLRTRSLVTIKDGDKVIVGPPAAAIIAQAGVKLDAGDLAGAVATLSTLDGAAANAMSNWRAQAQALLDARAALAAMAHG